jgi:small nuclear ribonucleoprotein B and B'
LRYVEHRLRITLSDSRTITGTFLAFDKHLNLVLSDTEEFRTLRKGSRSNVIEERQEKRNLGLIILRGENVVSIAVEGPPPPSASGRLAPGGPGSVSGAGRGSLPPAGMGGMAPVGLGAAPIAGVGGAVGSVMAPQGGMGMPPPGMGRGILPPHRRV